MTGLGAASITACTAERLGSFGGFPNSVISAPAQKVRPAQVSTIAFGRIIGDGLLHRLRDAGAQLRRERVDGWGIEGDDGDFAFAGQIHDVIDGGHGGLR